jgi:hypothetical protein
MARIKQNPYGHGSLKDIQILVNKNQKLIDKLIKSEFSDFASDDILWTSPLENDEYAEYLDSDFLIKVGLNPNEIQLAKFWPTGGPHWDALAQTSKGKIVIVEAKANIPELVSPATEAKEISRMLIEKSLNETKEFLNIKNDINWSGTFYQYTNRIAHLYFLREKCKKQAFLINIYFIGDESVSGPKTKQEWDGAIKLLHSYFGISRHKLSKYMADIFIDINELDK